MYCTMSYSQGTTSTDYVILSICESVCEGDAISGSECATLDSAVGKLLAGPVDLEVTLP